MNRRKRGRIIQEQACEYCSGSGRRFRVIGEISATQAMMALGRLRSRVGSVVAGQIDMEITIYGKEYCIDEIDGDDSMFSVPASSLDVGAWEIIDGQINRWRDDWSMLDLLKNRMDEALKLVTQTRADAIDELTKFVDGKDSDILHGRRHHNRLGMPRW